MINRGRPPATLRSNKVITQMPMGAGVSSRTRMRAGHAVPRCTYTYTFKVEEVMHRSRLPRE